MRKTLASTGIAGAAAAVVVLGLGSGWATNAQARPKPDPATALASANRALAENQSAIRGAAGEKYIAKDTIVDDNHAVHVRYDRKYHGLAVRGGDFVTHQAPGGAFVGANVAQQAPISVSTTPKLTAVQATAVAKKNFVGKLAGAGKPELIVDATKGSARLAWKVNVQGIKADQTPSMLDVVVDATTGAVVDKTDQVKHVEGTGNSVYSGQVAIDTTQSGTQYTLTDPVRGNGRTCDLNQGTSTCATMNDPDNTWGDGTTNNRQSAAVDAHFGAAKTYDYFKLLGRAGVFGDGRGVPSRVHYGNAYVNAFWNGSSMTYGDGAGNKNPLVSLDVAGHEMTHGVTERTAGLIYSGESGGLNESNSDIFGSMVEYYANVASDPGDYDIGEEINIFGDGKPLRYMYEPFLDKKSPNCWSSSTGGLGVHYSSGVGNHYFYLLAEGSTGGPKTSPTCGAPAVTGIGREKAAKIHFRALTTYWVSTTNYARARAGTLSAATDLYGKCGTEYKAVQAAWAGAGVLGNEPCTGPTTSPTVSPTVSPTTGPGGYFENATDVAIPDSPGAAVTSDISVTGRTGNAPSALKVAVDIKHTYKGDLVVDLIAPDGSVYNLHNRTGGGTNNIIQTFTVNASSEDANGVWKLRVRDMARIDTGKIDKWSLQF